MVAPFSSVSADLVVTPHLVSHAFRGMKNGRVDEHRHMHVMRYARKLPKLSH